MIFRVTTAPSPTMAKSDVRRREGRHIAIERARSIKHVSNLGDMVQEEEKLPHVHDVMIIQSKQGPPTVPLLTMAGAPGASGTSGAVVSCSGRHQLPAPAVLTLRTRRR